MKGILENILREQSSPEERKLAETQNFNEVMGTENLIFRTFDWTVENPNFDFFSCYLFQKNKKIMTNNQQGFLLSSNHIFQNLVSFCQSLLKQRM